MAENNQSGNSGVDFRNEILENDTSLLQVDYSLEEERLKSFATWPIFNPVNPTRLAKAGFYYSGKEDDVICFSCEGHIKDWNYGDIVQKRHAELFPNCDFVNCRSKNVPIAETRNQTPRIHCNINQKPPNCVKYRELQNLLSKINYDKMKSKTLRMYSFSNTWPLVDMNIVHLAEAGFFYLGVGDNVQCAFCKGVINDWNCDDDPFAAHRKFFPYCPYVLEGKNVPSDKKLLQSKSAPKWYESNAKDLCVSKYLNPKVVEVFDSNRFLDMHKVADRGQIHRSLIALGVNPYESPVYPDQASFNTRLRSFNTWSNSVDIDLKRVAEAGFFYTGYADHTKCFHCGGGLCYWEEDDDPWCEHARWFCNCPFLRLHKDDEFIRKCCDRPSTKRDSVADEYKVEEMMIKLDEAMNSPIVRKYLKRNVFPPYIIRAAVLRQIKETGSMFTNQQEMCVAVAFLREEMENMPLESCNAAGLAMNNINLRMNKTIWSTSDDDTVVNFPCNFGSDSICPTRTGGPQDDKVIKSGLTGDQCMCKICMDKEVGIVFLPCGHLLACNECASSLYVCPLCRKVIKATVKVFLP